MIILKLELVSQTFSFMVIRNCISAVQTGEERIDMSDVPEQEIEEFIDSLDTNQFKSLSEFIQVCRLSKKKLSLLVNTVNMKTKLH